MSACLQTSRRKKDHIHVLSCYSPTRAASQDIKDEFFADLEQALVSIPSDEPYILLGDLNACVVSRSDTDDTWEGVRGPHGYGESNGAGRELLTFLSTTEATVCNTWFRKNIHKQRGNTQSQNDSTVLTTPSYAKKIGVDAWMSQ